MAKIKRLINFALPVTVCNMRCPYCYVTQVGWNTNDIGQLDYPPEHIQRCLTKERLGGICHVNICGSGETLLAPYAVDLAQRMLENGHYVSIVTNGTVTKGIEELCLLPEEYRERLFFKFSIHYLELKKKDLLKLFFDNVRKAQSSDCAFSIELGAADEYVPYVEEIKAVCMEAVGAYPHVIELRKQYDLEAYSRLTALPLERHQNAFKPLHTEMLDFQQQHWGEKRREFCYAGEWVMQLDVGTGWFLPCFIGGKPMQNIFENPDEPIRFVAIGENCPWQHCYSSYILLTSGMVPALETPYYAEFRDCVDTGGHHWLTPKVAEFFSSKCSEANEEYSETKKRYINALMALEYQNRRYPYQPEAVGKIVAAALTRKKIRTVGIWGASMYTDWLFDLLMGTQIRIQYIVDPQINPKNTKNANAGMLSRIFSGNHWPVFLNGANQLPQVDAMIIADYSRFDRIKKEIPLVYGQLLSLTELVD